MKKVEFVLISVALVMACQTRPDLDLPDKVTFNEHIASIIHQNCTPCHRPDGGAPFIMISYQDVAKRAKMIRQVTADRFMPPWPADPHYRSFVDERVLSERDIAMLGKWVDDGKLEGEGNAPEVPRFPKGSVFGKPDLVLHFTDSIFLDGDNLDRFITVKVPFELPQDTFIRLIEFVPGNRELVHHMNGHLINYAPGAKADIFEGEHAVPDLIHDKRSMYSRLNIANDDGTFPTPSPSAFNYLPSVLPVVYPKGIGYLAVRQKAAFLIRNIHYGPTPIPAYDRSYINVFFAEGPPERPIHELMLGTLGVSPVVPKLEVAANKVMKVQSEYKVQQDMSLLTINPHMHLIGRSYKAWALTPKGDTIPLISIPKWDFRWQYFYTFHHMLKIPKGSVIHAEGLYDNTSDNPNNPFDPPRTVVEPLTGNMKTTDEMFQFIITYLPYREGDENISLESDLGQFKQ